MSNVPRAREAIINLVVDMERIGLHDLSERLVSVLHDLHRRPLVKPRAPVSSLVVDAKVAENLRRFAWRNPDLSQQAIGELFRTNAGRVSEALRGER
jgi:hypothetical protein